MTRKINYKIFSENQWVFPDDILDDFDESLLSLDIARGGNVMIQVLTDASVSACDEFSLHVDNANGIHIIPYQLVPVSIHRNSAPKGKPGTTSNYEEVKDFVTRKAPFDVYDATVPMKEKLAYSGRLAFALRFTASRELEPSVQRIKVTLQTGGKEYVIPITLTVHKATIPELKDSRLTVVNWVRPSSLVEHSGSERHSEAYWETYKKLLSHMVDIRNNHLSIAESWKRIPDEAIRDEDGKIIDFDLAPYEKALRLAEKAGMTKLYGPYIAHWEKWDKEEIYLLWDWEKKWRITGAEAYRQLKLYFKRIKEMIERNGWQDKYIQPLCDEPQFPNVEDYRTLCGIVRQLFPEVVIHDPVEVYNIAGAAEIICIKQAIYEKYLDEFKELQSLGQRMTYYACGFPAGPTMNRTLDLPLFVGRLSFWMCHRYNFEGYLHWGYHVEGGFDNTNHAGTMAPGNHSIVYYSDVIGDYVDTVRSNNQRAGAEDWELLEIIKEKNESLAQALVEKCCRTFDDYETDWQKIDGVRKEIFKYADEYSD